jgi:Helix-turn-helix domain
MARPPLYARPPTDSAEDRTLRRLASARHAPASLIQRARIISASWDGASVTKLAQRLGCHPKTVYKWLHRFNAHGLDGLGDLRRPGGWSRVVRGCWRPPSPRRRRAGPWTPWLRRPGPRASGWACGCQKVGREC